MKKIIRIILVILIILNCMMIFNFSAEKSEKSDETSGRVVNTIIEINPRTKNLNQKEKEIQKEKIVKPVRKTAHFSIYCTLGLLIYMFLSTYDINSKKKILISIMLSIIYACSDEIHQLFIPGRSGQIKDVLIDSAGASFGIIIGIIVLNIINKGKEINQNGN